MSNDFGEIFRTWKTSEDMELHDRLRMVREERDASYSEMARVLDVSVNTVRRAEQGNVRVAADYVRRVCGKLGVSADWLLFGIEPSTAHVMQSAEQSLNDAPQRFVFVNGEKVRVVCVPILTRVPAGHAVDMEDATPVGVGLEGWLSVPDPRDENAFALIAAGDSMEPIIRDGEPFLVSPRRRIGLTNGLAVIRLPGDGVCVKHVRISSRGVEVRSANPRYPARHYSAESIRLIGEALLVRDIGSADASASRELRN